MFRSVEEPLIFYWCWRSWEVVGVCICRRRRTAPGLRGGGDVSMVLGGAGRRREPSKAGHGRRLAGSSSPRFPSQSRGRRRAEVRCCCYWRWPRVCRRPALLLLALALGLGFAGGQSCCWRWPGLSDADVARGLPAAGDAAAGAGLRLFGAAVAGLAATAAAAGAQDVSVDR